MVEARTDVDRQRDLPGVSGDYRQAHPRADDLRREVAQTRQDMSETVSALEQKLSPRQVANELLESFRTSDLSHNKLIQVIRRNPLPASLTAAGLTWLIAKAFSEEKPHGGPEEHYPVGTYPTGREVMPEMGETSAEWQRTRPARYQSGEVLEYETGGGEASKIDKAKSKLHTARERAHERAEDISGQAKGRMHDARERLSDMTEHAKDRAEHLVDRTRAKAHHLRDQAGDAMDRTRAGAHSLGDRISDRASDARHQAQAGAAKAREGFMDALEEHPLALGAAAIGAGLLIGLLTPPTRREDRLMGEARDRVVDDVKDTGRDIAGRGEAVAEAAIEAAQQEAHEQNLTGDLADKAKAVAHEAKQAAEEEARNQDLTSEDLKAEAKDTAQKAKEDAKDASPWKNPEA